MVNVCSLFKRGGRWIAPVVCGVPSHAEPISGRIRLVNGGVASEKAKYEAERTRGDIVGWFDPDWEYGPELAYYCKSAFFEDDQNIRRHNVF